MKYSIRLLILLFPKLLLIVVVAPVFSGVSHNVTACARVRAGARAKAQAKANAVGKAKARVKARAKAKAKTKC